MPDSWLDDALRSMEAPPPSQNFTPAVLERVRSRHQSRRRRVSGLALAASGLAFACAVALVVWPGDSRIAVDSHDLQGLRQELATLRAELVASEAVPGVEIEGEDLQVELDALFRTEDGEPQHVINTLFAAEGGQL